MVIPAINQNMEVSDTQLVMSSRSIIRVPNCWTGLETGAQGPAGV